MARTRYRRRKQDRPAELTEAAMLEFSSNGYDATPVEAVAKRAGVSKGLLYLYFKTKEDLFKAVVRSFVAPRVDALVTRIDDTDLGVEEFLRGPFLETARELPRSRVRHLVRLMIAEGPKHPDLTRWYWENVLSKALDALQRLLRRGVQSGEIAPSAIEKFPQLLLSPVMFSVVWMLIMQPHHKLDTDAFIGAHVDLVLSAIKKGET
ncbi:MAG: TetR/AcrR family transcriptional regulator [Woeseia sp.]|nr:TetR/AcrR family transcriptional regulator [Woeseia sp.]NNE61923.1 TetR/AcrR family transcriptional regulator [Woeseia sp.]NNL56013.1 TetR/AcrR family transcriptional regulator [Woeseia sp.]